MVSTVCKFNGSASASGQVCPVDDIDGLEELIAAVAKQTSFYYYVGSSLLNILPPPFEFLGMQVSFSYVVKEANGIHGSFFCNICQREVEAFGRNYYTIVILSGRSPFFRFSKPHLFHVTMQCVNFCLPLLNFLGVAALHVGRQLLANCDGAIQVLLAFVVQVEGKNPLHSDF